MRILILRLTAILALFASLTTSRPALAQNAPDHNPIGKVMSVAGTVTVEHATAVAVQASLSTEPTTLKNADLVYRGDVVQTGRDGKVGITFLDGTAFNMSQNARMVLDEFVYDPKGKSNSSLISLTKGTFTIVAGSIAKTGDMKVETPVATMGIRGTTPHVEISEDGTVRFATLVEEGQSTAAQPPQRRANGRAPAPEALSPQQLGRYNKLFDKEFKICRNC